MADAVRGAGAGGAGGEEAAPRRPGKEPRVKKAASKKKQLADAENLPLNVNAPAESLADAREGNIEGSEGRGDSESEVILMRGPLRAQEMHEAVVGDLNEAMDKLKKELQEMQHRATTAEAALEAQKQSMHMMQEKMSTSAVFQEQIMTMVNYAVGPMQAELEGKKAEMAKLYNAVGTLNAQIAKANFDAKANAEVRRAAPPAPRVGRFPHPPLAPFVSQKAERLTKAWGCSLDEMKKENKRLKEQNLSLKADLSQVFSPGAPP